MKILYLDPFLHAINPSNTLMPHLIDCMGDVTFFGPGYLPERIVSAGVIKFAERTGPYDAIVTGTNMPLIYNSDDDIQASARYARKFTALSSPGDQVYRFYRDVLENLGAIPANHRFSSMVAFDYYSATQAHVDKLERQDIRPITTNAAFIRAVADLPDWVNKEKHFRRQSDVFSDAWLDYTRSHPERIITALHFVGDSEFSLRSLEMRKGEISIPGVDYVTRREASAAMKRLGMKVSSRATYNVYRWLNRAGIDVYANYASLKFFNQSYFYNLMNTRYVYTAAEAFGVPIRKYFEIPAAGALLLATECNGFSQIGFKDGANCVIAGPHDLAEKVAMLEAEPDRAQRIASAGRRLMFEQHSISARASQIKACMESVMAGTYRGADWIDGKFTMRADSKAKKSAIHVR